MKKIIIILLLATAYKSFSQDWPVKKMVMDKKESKSSFVPIPAFRFSTNTVLTGRGIYQELRLSTAFIRQIITQKPGALKLVIPLSNSETVTCELVKFDLGNIKFTENNKEVIQDVKIPVTYRGIISGEQNRNNVVLTVNENYLSLIATTTDRTLQLTRADETDPLTYRLYNSRQIAFPVTPIDCGTKSESTSPLVAAIQSHGFVSKLNTVQDKCVNVYVDCFDSLYVKRGSNKDSVISYVYELFNAVATGYFNEQINVEIMGINVWTTTDPYRGDTRENALADLANYNQDNFWGNICVGLDFSTTLIGRSGIADDIGRVKANSPGNCKAYGPNVSACCYNDLNYTTIATGATDFPVGPSTTGAAIYLVMHEMGHLLGAHHTFWCGWKLSSNPDVYGAIDSCGGVEGTCAQGPPPPPTGATIMSYCVGYGTPSQFVDFNNGFGPLPGAAIRNFVDQTQCIASCLACLIQHQSRAESDWAVHSKLPAAAARNERPPIVPAPLLYTGSKEVYWKWANANAIQSTR